jgi:hypothetical protein
LDLKWVWISLDEVKVGEVVVFESPGDGAMEPL